MLKSKSNQEKPNTDKAKTKSTFRTIKYIFLVVIFAACGFYIKQAIVGPLTTHTNNIEVNDLESNIKSIEELATTSYIYRETVSKAKDGIFSKEYVITFDGVIKAGIDLEAVKFELKDSDDIANPGSSLVVALPEAKILSHEDSNPITVYESGYSSKDLGGKRNSLIKKAKEDREDKAVKSGLLEQALDHAEDVLREFLTSIYGDKYNIIFDREQASTKAEPKG